MEIESLFKNGAVGYYSYCEVTQVILNDTIKNEYWNYFNKFRKRQITRLPM